MNFSMVHICVYLHHCYISDFCSDKAPGKYANPSNCASYYVCNEGYSGTLVEYCLAGFGWNDLTKICDEKVECIPDEEDPPVVDPSVNPAGMKFVNNRYRKPKG